ncbi:MAG: hypothetical protein OEO79_02050 [Gemmatimonadota bacterium]|nr:hypothetical protein [Gemmatimonadota bacterium]
MSHVIENRSVRWYVPPRRVAVLVAFSLASGVPAIEAQQPELAFRNEPAREIARFGAARVLEAVGPPLFGRREFYRPVPPLQLRNRWLVVQDSTFALVFTQPSGVKPDVDGYDGDIYLRALQDIRAIEVRTLVFNVWGDLSGYLGITVLMEGREGAGWDLHPRWPSEGRPTHEHRTSIMWIHRVMFDDESILQADLAPIAAAWSHVTGSAFEGLPEELLVRAVGS